MEVARRWMDVRGVLSFFFSFFLRGWSCEEKIRKHHGIYNVCVGVERATASYKRSESGQMCTGTDRHRMIDQEADQGVVTNRLID